MAHWLRSTLILAFLSLGLGAFGPCSFLVEPECRGDACCPEGTRIQVGTDLADDLFGFLLPACLVGLADDDSLRGGLGPDVLVAGTGDDEAEGGRGRDTLLGGPGDDGLDGGRGGDLILPGPGIDHVLAGPGDDTVDVLDRCELGAGEMLHGGPGYDVLRLPLKEEDALALGVSIEGFEEVVVDRDLERTCESECTPPCSRVPDHVAGLPDPDRWLASGPTRFRRTTAAERKANLWPEGAMLVEARGFLETVRNGSPRVVLPVPLGGDVLRLVPFRLLRTRGGVTFVERRFTAAALDVFSSTPLMHEYVNEGLDFGRVGSPDGALMRMIAGSDGGVHAGGVVEAMEVQVDAGPNRWQVDDLDAPGDPVDPQHVVVVSLLSLGPFGESQSAACGQFASEGCDWLCLETFAPCEDIPDTGGSSGPLHCATGEGVDNDNDGKTDSGDEECIHHPDPVPNVPDPGDLLKNATWGCDTHQGSFHRHRWESGRSFALFAEGRFCSAYQANWKQKVTAVGWGAEGVLAQAIFNYAPGAVAFVSEAENRYRYVAGGCWVFDGTPEEGLEAATDCAQGGACNVPDSNQYPYVGAGSSSSGYYDNVWDDVHHGTDWGLDDVISIAQVLYYGGVSPSDALSQQLSCQEEGVGSGCCGAAPTPVPATVFDNLAVHRRGTGVTQYIYSNYCPPASAPFTTAHEIGHATGLVHDELGSFMYETGGESSNLPNAQNQSQVWGCLTSWNLCPRPSGFRWSGD